VIRRDAVSSTLDAAMREHRAGNWVEAERLYRQLLVRDPNHAPAAFLAGSLALESSRLDDAADLFARAAALAPDNPLYQANLGETLRRLRRFEAAKCALSKAIALKPDLCAAVYNLGLLLQQMGELPDAETALVRALELNPRLALAHFSLGNVLTELGRLEEAVASFRTALELDPGSADVHNNLGVALVRLGLLDEALAAHRKAVELKPDCAEHHSNLVFNLHYHPTYDGQAILRAAVEWDRRHAQPLAREILPHDTDRNPDRRLRIGYLSPDFRDHCQANFLWPLLRNHDRTQFEIVCYSDVARSDEWTARLLGCADERHDIAGMNDASLAASIRRDRVDILVDLTMHMGKNRLQTFARKPAPIQVSWLAYPGTTGLGAMDYRITDPFLDSPGHDAGPYSERSLWMRDSFWCYDPLTPEEDVSPSPAAATGYVRIGCLNNFCKVNDGVVELWARVLREVDGARFTLLAPRGEGRDRALQTFEKHGVARGRIDPLEYRPRSAYLAAYRAIDLCLDTFPYNGHTTSLDAWWMGVPVVTLVGATVVGRAGLSQAMNLGLPQLVARTGEEYVGIAVELCRDVDRLAELRSGLRARMQRSPLMDGPRFARNVEAAYRRVWRSYCGVEPSTAVER
jgi:predicted O-linked N-acetylglucosamine transferase (SPINDLY family)